MIGAFLTETCAFGWRGAGVWKHSFKPSWFPTIRVGNYLGCISRGVDWGLWEICRIFSHSNCYLSLHTSIEFWSAKKNNWMVNFDLRSFAKSFAFPMRRKRIGDQSVTLHCGIRRTEKVTHRSGLTKSFRSPNKKKSINIKRKFCRQQLPCHWNQCWGMCRQFWQFFLFKWGICVVQNHLENCPITSFLGGVIGPTTPFFRGVVGPIPLGYRTDNLRLSEFRIPITSGYRT